MIAVLQRVSASSVSVDDQTVAAIGPGLTLLLGIVEGDDAGKMNRSLVDTGGELLVVSQFTLAASVKKGRRPSFDAAARPEEAERLYRYFIDRAARHVPVAHGVFGAHMHVEIRNDGPVTILVDSQAL